MSTQEKPTQFQVDLIRAINRIAVAEETKGQALGMIADQLGAIGTHLKYLGVGNAAGEMGAVEFLATKLEEAGDSIASAIRDHAEEV